MNNQILLRDLIIYLPLINENELLIPYPKELYHLNESITKQCIFLLDGIFRTESGTCIVYLNSEKEANEFKNVCEQINEKYLFFSSMVKNISVDGIYQLVITLNFYYHDKPFNYPESIFINNFDENFINKIRLSKSSEKNTDLTIFLWCDSLDVILPHSYLIKENIYDPEPLKINMLNFKSDFKTLNNARNILKKKVETYFLEKDQTEVSKKKRNTFKDNIALLFEFVEHHKRICGYYEKWKDYKIGEWYSKFKKKLFQKENYSTEKTYLQLIQNDIVKKSLDEYFNEYK